jgi:hypothetical protein
MKRIKCPRTYHLPFSEEISSDDKVMKDVYFLKNNPCVITEKMDGENTTMTREYIHARSVDSQDHESRHFVKSFWNTIRWSLGSG